MVVIDWLRNTVEATRQATVLLVRRRIYWLLLACCCVSAVIFYFVGARAASSVPGDELFGIVAYAIFIEFGLAFAVMYFGVASVHDELEDRTATYLFVRSVHRTSLLLGRWLAVTFVASLTGVFAIGLLYVALGLPDHAWRRGLAPDPALLPVYFMAAGLASMAYAAVGVAFGAWFKRPLVSGVAFIVIWEFMVSNAPPQSGVRGLTVADPVRRWVLGVLQPTGDLEEFLQRGLDRIWLQHDALGDPVRSLIYFTVVMLALGLWIYSRKEYDSRARE